MSELGSVIKISPISHGTTNIDEHAIENNINRNNNIFQENISNTDSINSSKTIYNQPQLLTTKLLNSPKKASVKYFNLNNSDLSRRSGPEEVQLIKELDKSNQSKNSNKNSVIKIKVKFIKDKNVDNKRDHISAPRAKIEDKILETNNEQVLLPELKIIAELYAKKNFDNNSQTTKNIAQKFDQHENILEKVILQENPEAVLLKENKPKTVPTGEGISEENYPNIVIAEEDISAVPLPPIKISRFVTSKEDNNCIFVENKPRPLSPIQTLSSPASLQFQAVEDLIQYHEREVHRNNPRKSLSSKTLPRMGTSALFNNKHTYEKSPLSDPEIISAMVRDRFIVNMYESRSSQPRRTKASTFGRIYKSLERAVATPDKNEKLSSLKNQNNHIIRIQQSSPIKLEEQYVSLNSKQNYTKQISLDDNDLFGNSTRQFFNLEEESTFQNKLDEMAQKLLTQNEIIFDKFDAKNEPLIIQEEKGCSFIEEQCIMIDFREEYVSNSTLVEEANAAKIRSDNQAIEHYEQPSESISTTGVELFYNMEEFLEKALGEELNKYDSQIDSTNEVCVCLYSAV